MNNRKRIAIDMDEVMADVLPKFEDLYQQEFGKEIKREDYWGKKLYDIEGASHIRNFLHDKGFFADLPVMPGSKEVIRELMEEYEIFIVTAAMEFRNSLEDKYDWLMTHFSFVPWKNFVFCGQKGMIDAEYMIDDHVRNLEAFKGKGLLFTSTHNLEETRFTRVDNWEEVRNFFQNVKD